MTRVAEPPDIRVGLQPALRAWAPHAESAAANFSVPVGERRLLAEPLRGAFRAGWKAARQNADLLCQPQAAAAAQPPCKICGWILRDRTYPAGHPDGRAICSSCRLWLTLHPEHTQCDSATCEGA